ncbi:MAG: glycoside hydrolase family 5 protein [Pseudomonadota bacterium]|nr:glycoside hydrolase family 5 protein [Pseudomonadota bacterium]
MLLSLSTLAMAATGAPAASGNNTASSYDTGGPAGRGGYLLPAGFLSTNGNQIVDQSGQPVRIAGIGWNGPDGGAGSELSGLEETGYRNVMDSIKADGFNTIRIPWSNVSLHAMPKPGTVSYIKNPGLQGLNTLGIFDEVVKYAGRIGLKIIFDHHTDDAGPHDWGGQQANGLWIDRGPGTDGTDGSGHAGTVTAARFEHDWVALARHYAGNPTVVGFDLDNEPTGSGQINWGEGGPTDIHRMCTDVGNAIQAVNPDALMICEGPQEWSGPAPGMPDGGPDGDLSGVARKPVRLHTPNKVVYSAHEYPTEISGQHLSAAEMISQMNAAWGYLVTQNIAPVWIGEMGSSMRERVDPVWAATLLDYMNGRLGSQGGPTFSGNQQPVSGSWWLAGDNEGQLPDGIQSAWGPPGHYRPRQQAVTDRMLFRPPSPDDQRSPGALIRRSPPESTGGHGPPT